MAKSERKRADRLLVERGLFESRAKAQAAIAAGLVTADGRAVGKASDEIACDAALRAQAAHPWVSRGGLKLFPALDRFGIDPAGCVCLDVGASTGGFTEVLLARGARCVYAIDVGHGQLHARLKARPEVISLENTDIRKLDPASLPEPPNLVVVDVSFISLTQALPPALALARGHARMLALIKPQFEAGRRRFKQGVVRDPEIHARACADLTAFVAALGWKVEGVFPSPVAGSDGNREFFIGARRD